MNEQRTLGSLTTTPWTRTQDGMLAGVCAGIARKLDVDPWLVRLIWLAAVLVFGTGILIYLVLAVSLPREDEIEAAQQKRLLGVCLRVSEKTGIDVGLARAIAVLLGLASLGATIVGYIVLNFVIPEEETQVVS